MLHESTVYLELAAISLYRAAVVLFIAQATFDVSAAPRSSAARAEFVRANPCPANGKIKGPCPGWEVDHTIPLKCNGPDSPDNMQWLTVEQHKAKTRR
ncbi:HNH endonuclease signature motif containing protein [Inhella gelatinilytica]|uniref:HNH endonuclease n=1 Tax=Inhella gelatinilytica TaxID=2795030 RepID=A0A931J0H4_9BURK|nr:HNH endonuclease signature motif containing protein [Inhella gelatinilytica]MBH9553141.1 HNH endonuclease [Inhella gelatinilytica]